MWGRILSMVLGKVGPLLQVILTQLTDRKTFDHVLEYAKRAVVKLEGREDMPGAIKRDAARESILADLTAIGWDVAPVLVNLAIEIALASLRAQKAEGS